MSVPMSDCPESEAYDKEVADGIEVERMNDANYTDMLAIGEQLRTQDNRITAEPMFCVQEKRREYGFDLKCTDQTVWIDQESGEYEESDTEKPGYEEVGYKDIWHTVMVAFTEAGCKDYLRQNGHNHNEPRIYVESFRRCDEMIAIRKWLMAQRTATTGKDSTK